MSFISNMSEITYFIDLNIKLIKILFYIKYTINQDINIIIFISKILYTYINIASNNPQK
jgi:hypothetical protein